MALATDSDIIRLCRVSNEVPCCDLVTDMGYIQQKHDCDVVPNDIPAFLRSVHPTIDVSEDGRKW